MSDLEPGQALMRHPDPTLPDQIVLASQVPHLEQSAWEFVEGDREEWPAELLPFGGQPTVRLYHPGLDVYRDDIAESAWPFHRARGWVLVEEQAEAVIDLEAKTVPELRELAKARGITPIPTIKPELLAALSSIPEAQPPAADQAGDEPAPSEEDED